MSFLSEGRYVRNMDYVFKNSAFPSFHLFANNGERIKYSAAAKQTPPIWAGFLFFY